MQTQHGPLPTKCSTTQSKSLTGCSGAPATCPRWSRHLGTIPAKVPAFWPEGQAVNQRRKCRR